MKENKVIQKMKKDPKIESYQEWIFKHQFHMEGSRRFCHGFKPVCVQDFHHHNRSCFLGTANFWFHDDGFDLYMHAVTPQLRRHEFRSAALEQILFKMSSATSLQ